MDFISFSELSHNGIWSLIFGLGMGFMAHFIYYWYLFWNGDKKYF